ncbi:hypothetical protein C9374_010931 [Naegleria lovaniensis]|uniref:Phosphatidic acid phosphatase type 2/haloperoxidase domain-containing protein n=1 Tax=Naegleria lovaniensis TaxID=51637 RepID=A0AA88KFT0_NAELO|nr:uncharacterized protein C9374_010931 [Naegleria lovaniensis]KAG2374361.1 hypothetical protein C9374_010931 [Naegleria lovaniensis]
MSSFMPAISSEEVYLAPDAIIKAFSFTFVVYEKGNTLSFIFALCALVPIFIVVAMAVSFFINREYQSLFVILGILANEIVNDFLKHQFAQDRPPNLLVAKFRNVDPTTATELVEHFGMPSSHSQFMFFFACTVLCWFKVRSQLWKNVTFLSLFGLASIVAYSRVALHYHTVYQVLAGSFVGLVTGNLWKLFIINVLEPKVIPFLDSFSFLRDFLCLHSNENIESTVEFQALSARRLDKKNK